MELAARRVLGGSTQREREHLGVSTADVVIGVMEEVITKGIPSDVKSVRAHLICVARRRALDAARRDRHELADDHDFEAHHDADPSLDDQVQSNLLAAAALEALEDLPENERYAMRERVMLERPAKEVGAELGVTPQRVSQLKNSALAKLRSLPAFVDLLPRDLPADAAPAASTHDA